MMANGKSACRPAKGVARLPAGGDEGRPAGPNEPVHLARLAVAMDGPRHSGTMQAELERIYREHHQGLFSLALAITRRAEQAEDAVHEAFTRLFGRATGPQGDAVAYVFACVRNAAVDQRRRQPAFSGEPIFAAVVSDPAGRLIEAEQQQALRDAVQNLPQPRRELVTLRLYAGLTFQQMADVLGQPLATVASNYRRTLERIKQEFAKQGIGD